MKLPLSDRLEQFLRKAKRLFVRREAERSKARRFERESKRVEAVFRDGGKPVLIHTYGKVGSTALQSAIKELPEFGSFQTHFISKGGIARSREDHLGGDPVHLRVGGRIREELERNSDQLVRVITLVRDPVARAVSDLFENPKILVQEGDLRTFPPEKVVAIAAEHIRSNLEYTERWFDQELSGLFGFDFFETEFDKEEGFQIIEAGRFSILAGKLELLSRNGGRHLGKFLELDRDLTIPKRRARSATKEASLYDEVREQLQLSEEVLEEVYSSRVFRHFYTDSEVENFKSNWGEPRT